MSSQVAILREAVDLLGGILQGWRERLVGAEAKNIRRSYINRHAWHVYALGGDLLVLAAAGRLGSIHLLSRPALESLFKLAASVADEGFAAQKVVAETEEEAGKIRNWLKGAPAEWASTLTKMIEVLGTFGEDLRKRYGVTQRRGWKTYEVAKLGKLEAEYVRDYFIGSAHVHAMLSALTAREDELYVPEALYRMTVVVTHTCGLVNKALMDLENSVAPDVFERAIDLHRRAKADYDAVAEARAAALKAQGF
jgi:hypothetical protein